MIVSGGAIIAAMLIAFRLYYLPPLSAPEEAAQPPAGV